MPTSPSRRLVLGALAATAAAGLSGCSTPWGAVRVQPLGGDPPPQVPEPGPDERARRAAVAGVLAVVAEVDRGTVPAALTTGLRAALGEQLAALGAAAPSTTPTAGPSTSPTAASSPSPTTSPAEPDGAAAAALLRTAAAGARSPLAEVASGTSRLLACLAAGLDVAAGWVATGGGEVGGGAASSSGASSTPSASTSTSTPTASSPVTPSATPAGPAGEQGALVAALAAEEASVYGYGVLAVHLQDEQRTRATADLTAHALAVEELREELLALGAAPPEPPPAWSLPAPVDDAAGAVALAVRLEAAVAATAADLVAATDRGRRAAAAARVLAAAVRGQAWRDLQPEAAGSLVALPGLSGR